MAGVCWGVSVGLGEGWSGGCFTCCTLSPAAPRQLSSVVDHSPCACRKPQGEADTPPSLLLPPPWVLEASLFPTSACETGSSS